VEQQLGAGFEEQCRTFSDQLATMGGPNGRRCQLNPHHATEEDEYSVEKEPVNPFGEHRGSTPWRMLTLIGGRRDSNSTSHSFKVACSLKNFLTG
jgi:hypothetical protein